MTIKQNLVSVDKYPLKCPTPMVAIGICVHNTANDASAKNEISYMVGNNLQTSFHFAVDDIEAWQGVLTDRHAWHAGDGATGLGNLKYIGIEICYSKSGGERFTKAEENATELIAQLLKERGWDTSKVKKHQDFSGKYCPHRTLDLGWDRFINKIKTKMGATMPADMYGTPLQYDLNNKESMKITVDHFNLIQTGQYIRKAEVDKLVETATKKGFDEGFKSGQALAPIPKEPPQELDLQTGKWALNGVQWSEGKLIGNYYKV